MSIRTSKRIALGVIAGLVFAPFAAIAPASAAFTTGTAVGNTTLTVVKPTSRPNVAGVFTVGFNATKGADEPATESFVVRAALTKPAGSSATISLANAAGTAAGFNQMAVSGTGTAALTFTGDAANAAVTAAANTLQVDATLNPDVVGTYTLMYFADLNNNSAIDSGEAFISQTTSVVADAPVLSVAVYGSTTSAPAAVAANKGALVRLTLTNGGVATSISGTELFQLSGVDTFATGGTTAKTTVTRADFNADGIAWVQAQHTTAGVRALVIQGVGGGIASLSRSATITFLAPTALTGGAEITAFAKTNTTGVATATDNDIIPAATSTTLTYKATGATTASATTFEATDVVEASVVDTLGAITGKATLGYVVALTLGADATASFSVTVDLVNNETTAPTAGTEVNLATVTLEDTTDNVKTIQSALRLSKAFSVTPTSIRVVNGSTVDVTGNLKDQFGTNKSNTAVTATLSSGRNSGVFVTRNLVTDASGNFAFSYTDAPLAANIALTTDTFAIVAVGTNSDAAGGGVYADGAVVVTYAASLGVSTVTLGGGNNSAAGVALTTPTINDIKAGAGAETGAVLITATVKDANASVLSGIPVTWTVSDSGTKAGILSTRVTSTTNASGETTTSVYAWVNGTYTVTAVAGGVTSTVTVDFRQTAGGSEERTITAAATGRVITATVIDRFGNPVPGVTVYATAPAGNAFLGAGTKSAELATNVSGQAAFVVGGTDATITVSTINPATVGGVGSGQTCAAAARISCAAAATALVAATVGTATTAETGVGNSIAPAGVATATAAVTGITPVVVVPPVVYDNPTLSFVKDGGRVILSGTAVDGEGDIIIYTKKVGTTAWKERAKTLEVAAPGDFNGSIKAPKSNVLVRVKQEGTGQFSNQIIVLK